QQRRARRRRSAPTPTEDARLPSGVGGSSVSHTMKLRFLCLALCATLTPLATAQDQGKLWDDLLAGNGRYVAGKPNARDLVADRTKLANTQSPKVGVLACADSRLAPELVFDKTLGDLFVVRSAGNSPDPIAIGSFEYAVEHLGTTMIVVMGHESCGA